MLVIVFTGLDFKPLSVKASWAFVFGTEWVLTTNLCMLMPSLANGGAERVGVTLLNEWHRRGYDVQLVLVASEQR